MPCHALRNGVVEFKGTAVLDSHPKRTNTYKTPVLWCACPQRLAKNGAAFTLAATDTAIGMRFGFFHEGTRGEVFPLAIASAYPALSSESLRSWSASDAIVANWSGRSLVNRSL
jgi:hypothetical protein